MPHFFLQKLPEDASVQPVVVYNQDLEWLFLGARNPRLADGSSRGGRKMERRCWREEIRKGRGDGGGGGDGDRKRAGFYRREGRR